MIIEFTVSCHIKSINEFFRNRRNLAYSTYKKRITKAIQSSGEARHKFTEFSALFRFPKSRKDLDNHSAFAKAFIDSLREAGYITDDSPKYYRYMGMKLDDKIDKIIIMVYNKSMDDDGLVLKRFIDVPYTPRKKKRKGENP